MSLHIHDQKSLNALLKQKKSRRLGSIGFLFTKITYILKTFDLYVVLNTSLKFQGQIEP
jgi:hypothetical protein